MKLKGKILTLVLVPIVVLVAIIYVICSIEVTSNMKFITKNDLSAVARMIESDIQLGGDNQADSYYVDENGDMWNGGILNLTKNLEEFDDVKEDCHMDITIFYGDTRYVTTVRDSSGNRVVGTQAGQAVIDTVLKKGEEFFAENVDVQGVKYFAFYRPIYNGDDPSTPVGMVFVGIPEATVTGQIRQVLNSILITGLIVAIICGAVAVFIVIAICKKINVGVATLGEVSHGNLDAKMDEKMLKGKDEISDIARAVNRLRDELAAIVGDINLMVKDVNSSADSLNEEAELSATHISQIDTAVNEIAQGATTQAQETQNTTENVIVMGDMIEKNNEEIDTLNTAAADMTKAGDGALSTLGELEGINKKTREAIDVIYDQTNTTNDSAMKIKEAINLITDIAEETNLLSLNASIEAARAGEQGRGFAVVASQIQKLAEQSNESARKIEEIVASLIDDSEKAVETMNEVRVIMGEQNEKVDKTSNMFKQLKKGIDDSVAAVNVIADSTKTIDSTRVSVVDAAQSLTSIAEENAASSQETSAAVTELTGIVENIAKDSQGLKEIADKLSERFRFFKLSDATIAEARAELQAEGVEI